MTTGSRNSSRSRRHFRFTPALVVDQLSSRLYKKKGAALLEALRNAAAACQRGPTLWEPERVHIEVSLVRDHPAAGKGLALVIWDAGHGFTEADWERFFDIGASGRGRHGGAGQQQIGKLAALSLNEEVIHDYDQGCIIFTRTSSSGPVQKAKITPNVICSGEDPVTEVGQDAKELHDYRNRSGSFTMLVIPNSSIHGYDELRAELRDRIPCLRHKAWKLLVDGKQLNPPELIGDVRPYGSVSCTLRRTRSNEGGGIWIVDARTGLPCVYCPDMGGNIHYPLNRKDLSGVIVVEGVLAHQTTDRSGLERRYLESKGWLDVARDIQFGIVPFAQELLGDADVIDTSSRSGKVMSNLADRLIKAFGPSSILDGDLPSHGGGGGGGSGGGHGGGHGSGKGGSGSKPRGPRGIGIKIGEEDYVLRIYGDQGNTDLYVEARKNVLFVNPHYANGPKAMAALEEHCMDLMLFAVAVSKNASAERAMEFAGKLRKDLKKGEGKDTK